MTDTRIARLTAVLACAWFAGCAAGDASAGGAPDLVLVQVSVIDGLGNAPVPNRTIEIRDGRISALRPSADGDSGLDLSGYFVSPGLIDTHQHLPAADSAALRNALDSLLGAGITAVREIACCGDVYQRLAVTGDSAAMPRLFWSAFWADSIFMTGDPRVRDTPGAGTAPWLLAVSEATDLDAAVRAAVATGATGLKIYSNVGPALVADIARVAHAQGLKVWTHPVVFPTRPSEVVAAGSDVISHAALLVWEGVDQLPATYNEGHPFNPFGPPAPYGMVRPDDPRVVRVLEQMRDRGTILDPTVSTMARAVSAEASAWAVAVTRLAHGMGIPISAGTDNGRDGHNALFRELEMLVDSVGFTPLEAHRSATSVGAAVLGAGDDLGVVASGRMADLVVYRDDPTVNISRLRSPVWVIRGGVVVRRGETTWRDSKPDTTRLRSPASVTTGGPAR